MYFKKAWCLLFVCSLVSGVLFGPLATYGQEKVSLRFMYQKYPERARKVFAELIPAFEKENPNVQVTPIYTGAGAYQEKMIAWVAAKKDPDVHWTGVETWRDLIKARGILLFDKYADEELLDRFIPRSLEIVRERSEGKLYALPADCGAWVLWYNRDLYREVGLDPDSPPKDWYEFLGYSIKITEGTGVPGVGSNASSRHDTVACIWPAIYHSFTGDSFLTLEGKAKFNSNRGVEALKYWVDLTRKYGVTQPDPAQYKKSDLRPLLRDQKVAMIVDGWWVFPLLKEVHDFSSREKATIATAPIPKGPTTAAARIGMGLWVISANSKYPEEAWKLVEFLVRPESEYKINVTMGSGPTQKALMNMPEYKKWYWGPYEEAASKGFGHEYWKPVGMAYIDALILNLQKTFAGEMTPKEALDAAAKEVNELTE